MLLLSQPGTPHVDGDYYRQTALLPGMQWGAKLMHPPYFWGLNSLVGGRDINLLANI